MTRRNATRTQRDDRLIGRTVARVNRLTDAADPARLVEPVLICYAPTPDGICGERYYECETLTRINGAHRGRRRAPHCSHDVTWAWYADPASGRRLIAYGECTL